eukprot:gene8317-863_t
MKGWLLKEGPPMSWVLGRQWLRRYFVLDEDNQKLLYYTEPSAPAVRGEIGLGDAHIIEPKECLNLKSRDFCFGIRTKDNRTYYLIAEHAGLVKSWLQALQKVDPLQEKLNSKERMRFPRKVLQELDLNPSANSRTAQFLKLRRQRPVVLSSADNQIERFPSKEVFEKSVVAWDTSTTCKLCNTGFSFTKSKTHCRLCGATICDREGCSNMLNLFEVGRVTGVLSSQVPSASERDSVVAVCVRCETNIQQAHKGAVIAKAARGATQLQTLYEQACSQRAEINSQLERFESLVNRITSGNTAPALKDEVNHLRDSILTDIRALDAKSSKMERLPVKDKKSQRLQFQAAVSRTFFQWGKETKLRVTSLANALGK